MFIFLMSEQGWISAPAHMFQTVQLKRRGFIFWFIDELLGQKNSDKNWNW